MDIVFNVDNGYVRHMCVTMLSIIEHNREEDICFHVVTCDLADENVQYVKALVAHKSKVHFYHFDKNQIIQFAVGSSTGNPNISHAAYLRLFLQDILPTQISKVLYLDCDIVVINSLKDLWNTDINHYAIAARVDYGKA